MARRSHSTRAMLVRMAAVGLLASLGVAGCAEHSCTSIYKIHQIEMARDFDLPAAGLASVRARMCVGGTCREGTPGTDGRVSFEPAPGQGSSEATITPDASASRARIVVTFSVGEGSKERLSVEVKDATEATLLDASATVSWTDDDCHPEPVSKKL